jgi:predicted nucleic acid-binding Zn ribbon protein
MEQLFAAIPSIVKSLEPNKDVADAVVFAAWNQVAGEQIRSHTKPLRVNNKRLVIAVVDETWRQNLEALSPQMIAKLNKSLGDGTVTFIEFRVTNFELGT